MSENVISKKPLFRRIIVAVSVYMNNAIDRKMIFRRVTLFVILVNIFAWAGWFIAQDDSQEAMDLGNLIWLVSPFLLTILFRLFTKDWKDFGLGLKLIGNLKWYVFSIIIMPTLIFITLFIGKLFHVVSFTSLNSNAFIQAMLVSAGFILVKNTFEEFAWRGYLTPKLEQFATNRLKNHFVVGLIWGLWHIPYYMGLLDSTSLNAYTSLQMGVFIPLIIFSMIIAAVLFGEIRLITGSVWPVVLMHTVSNLVIMTLLLDQFIEINPSYQFLFTPSWEGCLMLILLISTGLWVRKRRLKPSYIDL